METYIHRQNLFGARIVSMEEFTRIVSNAKMQEIPECLQRIIELIGSVLTEKENETKSIPESQSWSMLWL